jgi:hypothetical protein
MIMPQDTKQQRQFYGGHYLEMLKLAARPFRKSRFDFSDHDYFRQIFLYGDRVSRMPEFRRPRGGKHFI